MDTDEDLIKYAWPQDVWFHVDKLSSAHVYLRMPEGMTWDTIPEPLLIDCAQLVKANSIEGEIFPSTTYTLETDAISCSGNKKDNIAIIWTPGDNLKVQPPYLVSLFVVLTPEDHRKLEIWPLDRSLSIMTNW